MIHARHDYDRFQDPALAEPTLLGDGCSPIGEDEPVMLFRAKDVHFVGILHDYLKRLREDFNKYGGDAENYERMVSALDGHIALARRWQTAHGTKAPDMPEGA